MEGRLAAAFAEEERRGLMLAGKVRAAGMLVILVWLIVQGPEGAAATAYEAGLILVFLFSGLAHLILVWRRHAPIWVTMGFVTLDSAFLGVVMVIPNPFAGVPIDPATTITNAYFVAFYLLLMQATFSYQARLVVYTGAVICVTWALVLAYALSLPGTRSEFSFPGGLDWPALIAVIDQPGFLYTAEWLLQIIVTGIVTAGLSLVVIRARTVAMSRASAERARANLACYFPPAIVDLLADREQDFGLMRRQEVAVLFADIRGFTRLAEAATPERVMELLRGFHARMEAAVFTHGGMMEKYIGDAMLATFGAPRPGPRDAADALACARDMLERMADWNADRAAAGEVPLSIGIGLAYGPAVQGDIGTGRSMAFAVIGDTVNTAARLQTLAGRSGWAAIIADGVVARVGAELGPAAAAALAGLTDLGARRVRGREAPIRLWGLGPAAGGRAGPVDAGRSPAVGAGNAALATPRRRAQGLPAGTQDADPAPGRGGERDPGEREAG